MKSYFRTLKQTFSNISYYKEIFKTNFNVSLKFFVISMFILGLMRAAIFTFIEVPQNKKYFEQTSQEILANYPNDMTINWDTENLTVKNNQEIDELEFEYPSYVTSKRVEELGLPPQLGKYVNIDDISADKPGELFKNNLFVLTRKNILVGSTEGRWQAFPLKDLPEADKPVLINKENLPQFLDKIKIGFLALLDTIQNLSWFVLPVVKTVSRFFSALVLGILAYFLAKINSFKFNYIKTLQISLHLVVIAEFIDQLGMILYRNLDMSLFSISFWILYFYLLISLKRKKQFTSQ